MSIIPAAIMLLAFSAFVVLMMCLHWKDQEIAWKCPDCGYQQRGGRFICKACGANFGEAEQEDRT